MLVVAIMQDGLDTANRHASSSAVWLLCRQRLQLLALAAHTFSILCVFARDAPKCRGRAILYLYSAATAKKVWSLSLPNPS